MRKRVAADFMAAPMQLHDGFDMDALPIAAPFIDQIARDIERRPCIVLVENGCPGRGGAFGKIAGPPVRAATAVTRSRACFW